MRLAGVEGHRDAPHGHRVKHRGTVWSVARRHQAERRVGVQGEELRSAVCRQSTREGGVRVFGDKTCCQLGGVGTDLGQGWFVRGTHAADSQADRSMIRSRTVSTARCRHVWSRSSSKARKLSRDVVCELPTGGQPWGSTWGEGRLGARQGSTGQPNMRVHVKMSFGAGQLCWPAVTT